MCRDVLFLRNMRKVGEEARRTGRPRNSIVIVDDDHSRLDRLEVEEQEREDRFRTAGGRIAAIDLT